MTTVINIHKDSFMFMTGVMSCLWQCHVSLMHTPSNKVFICLVCCGLSKQQRHKRIHCEELRLLIVMGYR